MIKRVVLMLLVLGYALPAFAGKTSGELFNECHKLEKSPSDKNALISDVYCASYIDGVVDGYRIVTDLHASARFICLPASGLTNEAVIEIFSKWLQRNPKEKETPARSGVLLSLKEAYPCK